jgi:hypothetical protein
MTKHVSKKRTFIPPDPFELVPEANRTDDRLETHISAWLAKWSRAKSLYGPEFIAWFEKVVDQNRQILSALFYRYGIQPSLILDELEGHKRQLLSRQQLESGLWLKGMSSLVNRNARMRFPDSELAKIRRNKKLREAKAEILERAAAVLRDYPLYFDVLVRAPTDEIIFDLPKYIKAIAARIRQESSPARHRPKERVARMVLKSLTDTFRLAVKKPLYEHAGMLTKTCFPEEWNPAGDVREAAKKLVKSRNYKGFRKVIPALE